MLVLFAFNVWLHSDAAGAGAGAVWPSLIGVLLLGVSGWLGGEMVYVHGVGQREAAPVAPRPGSERLRAGPSKH